jgi:hypothetical protein
MLESGTPGEPEGYEFVMSLEMVGFESLEVALRRSESGGRSPVELA